MKNYDQNKLKVCIQRKYDIIWQEANKCFHDMYIPGSKDLYPYLVYQIQGLKPEQLYNMTLHFERSDESRWEGRGDKYYPSEPSNAPLMSNTVWHELGPRSGKFWMTRGCSFIYLRVTSKINPVPPPNTISLRLSHKYIPVLSIYLWPNNKSMRFPPATFRIAHTEFLAAPCPTKNERLSMLTTIRRKKNFTIREKIRSDGKDKPTIYATCRVEHYLTHAQEISTQPLWSTVSRYPYLLETSKSDCSIHDKDSGVSSETEQECPIFQAEVDSISSFQHQDSDISEDSTILGPESGQECPIFQKENTDSSFHDTDSDISGDLEQECPILQLENCDAGEQHVNCSTSPVPQINLESEEDQQRIKIENPESPPQIDSRHQSNKDASEQHVNCDFTSPIPQVNIESGENQDNIKIEIPESSYFRHQPDDVAGERPVPQMNLESGKNQKRIKVENPESPRIDTRHQPKIVVGEPPMNGFTSPVPQVNIEAGENQRRIKVENPESPPQTDSSHQAVNVVSEPPMNGFTSPVLQKKRKTGENQERIKVENLESPQIDLRHPLDNVVREPPVNEFTSPVPRMNMESGKDQERIKIENPESTQLDSRHQPDNVVAEPSPIPQLLMETEVTPRRIKLENPSSPPSDSCHQPANCFQNIVTGDPVVNGSTSPVLQKKRKSGENQERVKIENHESPTQTDSRHQPDNVVGEPPVNGHVLQKKRKTGEFGSHHFDSRHLPCPFFPQHQPTPNFANFPYWGMQPNLNHLAFYSQWNSHMMPNHLNPHPINHHFFPSANCFTFPNPDRLMTTYPNQFYPTTLNYSAYQNMPPNYQFPTNFQVPMRSLANGPYPVYQTNPDNSAWWNIPNPGRFS
ncbi:hypothetical protein CAEBREN_01211 [Caenorhabditis brenneri]|uniref:T-box domain-containing protein n=1 Tax=Caenorhabditis brenneri TaxID=135651 RepID=G0NIL2_CAEBE|nr:hypothetical protein CAEBREN_01211 [Caenorhabditis brenneri]